MDAAESMDEDFTGFDEEPVLVNSGGTAIFPPQDKPNSDVVAPANKPSEDNNDSDSGNLVIAEPSVAGKKTEHKTVAAVADRSPRKRRSKVEEVTPPTRTPSSRVRGQGLAYLLAMEKGGSKKQLAKAHQAQVMALEIQQQEILPAESTEVAEPLPTIPLETHPQLPEAVDKRRSSKTIEGTSGASAKPPLPPKSGPGSRKSYSSVNISSPLLKEPFKAGDSSPFFSQFSLDFIRFSSGIPV